MPTLYLIPARSGSKGIPQKNLKPFCGESLVSRAVRQALECASDGDVVFVSTDSPDIAAEAGKHDVETPFLRPLELASDSASTYSVIIHVLEEFHRRGTDFDRVILLQPTSPFRTEEDIKKATQLWRPGIDMVVSVCLSKSNPYYNLFEEDGDGFLKISKGDGEFTRRQDAPKVWEYNGAVYVMSVASLLKRPINRFKKVILYEMPSSRSLDLDTPNDWALAESLFKCAQTHGEQGRMD
ncbi:MAG: acylneuraminate cytidylyltransferase family protein [Muribaculaceae bacterium]|nr:acylneuraminate cytidylyltransferase family protein [Muribaculaceae bacterium]